MRRVAIRWWATIGIEMGLQFLVALFTWKMFREDVPEVGAGYFLLACFAESLATAVLIGAAAILALRHTRAWAWFWDRFWRDSWFD